MPLVITPEATAEALGTETFSLELVPRNCRLKPYKKLATIPVFSIKDEFIAYASPDSTYAVTRRLFDAAQDEIVIGIYDFSADYMKDLVLSTMQRGIKVSLMLDIDNDAEKTLFDELRRFGCDGVPAPSCASKNVSYFPSAHEKVIVIDGTWTLVQSGNYSTNSIPFNEKDGGDPKHFVKGNRDMGIAIKSKPLAAFFTKLLKSDMKLERDAEQTEALASFNFKNVPDLVEAVPKSLPATLFPSKTFQPSQAIKVTPVLTPDNYMDVIPAFIESAKHSILIENQYIRSSQPNVARLLQAIKNARAKNPALDVRIVLGKLFSQKDVPKERLNIMDLEKTFGLTLGQNIRYINTNEFVHCHNKVIIVDNQSVLVSSQNWSDTGVGTNREAGLLLEYPEVAQYYSRIFESDWSTALHQIPVPHTHTITLEAVVSGNFVRVSAADYQDV